MNYLKLINIAYVGDAANLASRLCSSAKAGVIIISSEISKLLVRKYNLVKTSSIEVKGNSLRNKKNKQMRKHHLILVAILFIKHIW